MKQTPHWWGIADVLLWAKGSPPPTVSNFVSGGRVCVGEEVRSVHTVFNVSKNSPSPLLYGLFGFPISWCICVECHFYGDAEQVVGTIIRSLYFILVFLVLKIKNNLFPFGCSPSKFEKVIP